MESENQLNKVEMELTGLTSDIMMMMIILTTKGMFVPRSPVVGAISMGGNSQTCGRRRQWWWWRAEQCGGVWAIDG